MTYILHDMNLGGWISRMGNLTSDWQRARHFARDEALAVARARLDHNGTPTVAPVCLADMEEAEELRKRDEARASREAKVEAARRTIAAATRADLDRMPRTEMKRLAEETEQWMRERGLQTTPSFDEIKRRKRRGGDAD